VGGQIGGMATPGRADSIVKALLAEDKSEIADVIPRTFRNFAEANGNDLKALAACMSRPRSESNLEALKSIRVPVLIVVGTNDVLVGSPDHLVQAIPKAQLLKIEGRDHLSTVGDKRYKEAVAKFFAAAPA
jgi:pimeloyl-ACP methyl ester carboxylesterase